jgi:phosphopantetheinyl transferase (holo-ACP synthase)
MTHVAVHLTSLPGHTPGASRALTHTVLAQREGRPVRITADEFGPPRAQDSRTSFSISHDRTVLVVAVSDVACGVDVEDAAEHELAEVAYRFCSAAELTGGLPARMWWTAKESAAKAMGRGLRAGLRSISFAHNPVLRWSTVDHRERRTDLLTRVVELNGRHFGLTVRAPRPPSVSAQVWKPLQDGESWRFVPEGRLDG